MVEYVKKGDDVFIHPSAIIKVEPTLGKHIAIDIGVVVTVKAFIGDYVHIAPYVCIIGGKKAKIIMEDFSNISAGSVVVCGGEDFTSGMLNPIVPLRYRNVINKPVTMKRFSAIGAHSTILQGVTMAEGSILGANSLLTKDTEPWGIYVGSPAKRIGTRDMELIIKASNELGYKYEY